MKILGINGSHRPGKGTSRLLRVALEAAQAQGAEVELVELAELHIEFCSGCNACIVKNRCTISDDMDGLKAKMSEADGIILASPDYFCNVSSRMKCFMERTRPLHMVANALKGKVGGAVVTAGFADYGAESTMATMERYFATHEMISVHPRPVGPIVGSGTIATQFAGVSDEGVPQWRPVTQDVSAMSSVRQLGLDVFDLIKRLG